MLSFLLNGKVVFCFRVIKRNLNHTTEHRDGNKPDCHYNPLQTWWVNFYCIFFFMGSLNEDLLEIRQSKQGNMTDLRMIADLNCLFVCLGS